MAKKRNRRRGCWRVYDHAAGRELEYLIQTIVQLADMEGSVLNGDKAYDVTRTMSWSTPRG